MSKFNIEAKNDFVITKAVVENQNKPFEVHDSNTKHQYLEVVSCGSEVKSCKPGDKVIPYGESFQAFNYHEQQYVVLTDEQVLGVVNE